MKIMEKIIRHLKTSNNVLIISHIEPDGDAIGSLIALGLSLNAVDIETTMYNQSPIPMVYRFIPAVDRIQRRVSDIRRHDTIIVLDCADISRAGSIAGDLDATPPENKPKIINIDHHVTNTHFGDYCLLDVNACATAEIVYKLIKKMLVPINPAIATSIYMGILTDTGSFRFSNTNRAAFSICDEMVKLGVDPYTVAKYVYGTYSLGRIKLLNLALNSIEISDNGKLSLMTITREMFKETRTRPEDVDGIINYAKIIEDVKVAVLIQENGKKVHVSLRSDGSIDVAQIATDFGGGGHHSAAGFSVAMGVHDLKNQIFNLADSIQ